MVNVQPKITDNPILPADTTLLMSSIRSSFRFETPDIEHWITTSTDFAYDIPLPNARTLRGFKLEEFEYKGLMIHAYRRRVRGKWHLRIECHTYPHVGLADYPSFLESIVNPKLLEACGKA
jgi:hypothetical protein